RLPHRPHEGGAARGHVPAGTAWDRGKWGTGGAVPDVGRPRLSWVGRRSQPGPGLVVPRGRGRGGSRRRTVLCWLSSFGRGGSLLLSFACAMQSASPSESGGGHDAGVDDQVAPDLLPGRFERAWLPNRQVGG